MQHHQCIAVYASFFTSDSNLCSLGGVLLMIVALTNDKNDIGHEATGFHFGGDGGEVKATQ